MGGGYYPSNTLQVYYYFMVLHEYISHYFISQIKTFVSSYFVGEVCLSVKAGDNYKHEGMSWIYFLCLTMFIYLAQMGEIT